AAGRPRAVRRLRVIGGSIAGLRRPIGFRRPVGGLRPVRGLGLDRLWLARSRPLLPTSPLAIALAVAVGLGRGVASWRLATGLSRRSAWFHLFDVDWFLAASPVDGLLAWRVRPHLWVVPEHELLLADPGQAGDDEIDVHRSGNPNVNDAEEQRHEFLYPLHLGVGGSGSRVPRAELSEL